MSDPLVSIVIPCFKQAHCLPQAIKSCLEQTYSCIEIVVVDDGSPDDVASVVRPFGKRVRLICQKNKGLSGARNTGINASGGAYLKFLDADDWLLPHCIEQQMRVLTNLPNHIAICGYRLHYENSQRADADVVPEFGKLTHRLCWVNPGPPHIYLFPMILLRELGGFCIESMIHGGHEDYELICRIAAAGWESVMLHTVGCVYRQVAVSMSKQKEDMQRTNAQVWCSYMRCLLERPVAHDLMTHMIGGYVTRVYHGYFRYEASPLFLAFSNAVASDAGKIPQEHILTLLQHFTLLLNNMPRPESQAEKEQCRACIQRLSETAELLMTEGRFDFQTRPKPFFPLLELADAQIGIGRADWGRKHLRRLDAHALPNKAISLAVNIYIFLSYILPGRLAAGIWRGMRAFAMALRPVYVPVRLEEPAIGRVRGFNVRLESEAGDQSREQSQNELG